jgi:hypothetical protein
VQIAYHYNAIAVIKKAPHTLQGFHLDVWQSTLVLLRRQDLAATIHAGFQVNMVWAAKLARILVLNKAVWTKSVV